MLVIPMNTFRKYRELPFQEAGWYFAEIIEVAFEIVIFEPLTNEVPRVKVTFKEIKYPNIEDGSSDENSYIIAKIFYLEDYLTVNDFIASKKKNFPKNYERWSPENGEGTYLEDDYHLLPKNHSCEVDDRSYLFNKKTKARLINDERTYLLRKQFCKFYNDVEQSVQFKIEIKEKYFIHTLLNNIPENFISNNIITDSEVASLMERINIYDEDGHHMFDKLLGKIMCINICERKDLSSKIEELVKLTNQKKRNEEIKNNNDLQDNDESFFDDESDNDEGFFDDESDNSDFPKPGSLRFQQEVFGYEPSLEELNEEIMNDIERENAIKSGESPYREYYSEQECELIVYNISPVTNNEIEEKLALVMEKRIIEKNRNIEDDLPF